jgi:two-component system, response regulator
MSQLRHLVLVEDNGDDEELTLRAISQFSADLQVAVARDGMEAVQYFRELQPEGVPQLVLLDLKLPKCSGLEVLKSIRSNPVTTSLPVVILTSSDESRDILACYEAGSNSYVRKEIDYHRFTDTMHEMLNYWYSVNLSAAGV